MKEKPSYEALERQIRMLQAENRRLKESERDCTSNEARLQSLLEIFQHPARHIQDLLEFALEEAIGLTGSKIGYIYHYNTETRQLTLNNWSEGAQSACSISRPERVYDLGKTGLWGEAVRQQKPIVINDYKAPHPLKKGCPEGHAELFRFMSVPVFNDNRIVAVAGMANKDTNYTYGDVLHVTLLMDAVWKMVQRRETEDALRKSGELLQKTQEIARIGSWEIDIATGSINWSEQAYRIAGMRPGKTPVTYQSFLEIVHPADRKAVDRTFRESVRSGRDDYDVEHRVVRQDTGEVRYVHEKCEHERDPSGKIVRSVGMVADITERRQVEERLRKFNEELETRVKERTSQLKKRTRQLQRLAMALTQAEDREQQKISRVLHEDLQQMLVSARLHLDILDSTENQEHREILLRKTRELLQASLRKTRDLSHDMSPPVLSHSGLAEAMGWLARKMRDHYGLEVSVACEGFQRPRSRTIERFLFRSAREMLFNVVKHADVNRARVELTSGNMRIRLVISDEGKGFNAAVIGSGGGSGEGIGEAGIGIYSIRERIDLLGGRLDIQSAPGRGTRSVIEVPDAEAGTRTGSNL